MSMYIKMMISFRIVITITVLPSMKREIEY